MPICTHSLAMPTFHQPLLPSSKSLALSPRRPFYEKGSGCGWRNRGRQLFSGGDGVHSAADVSEDGILKKRKIVEHILLLKAKEDISDVEENDMLDHLYTSQYQMRGIMAISLGRVEEPNDDNFTHAVYMRFQRKEDLEKFYVDPYYSGVLKGHVMPYCYVCTGMG